MTAVTAAFVLFAPALFGQSGGARGPVCSDPLAVMKAFYDSTDSLRFAEGAKYFAEDAVFDTWATGVNGYILAKRHLEGRKAIAAWLKNARGLRWHLPDAPRDGPVYHETRVSVSGSVVQFMLEPDRLRPNGKQYPPFSIEATLDGCHIKSITVVERVTWL
ncbi:MAG: hypothetical protein ABSG17_06775 [Spirochaetia bacterium]